MRCPHEWIKEHEVKRYVDASGFEVVVFECHCKYCEKRRKIKYVYIDTGQLH